MGREDYLVPDILRQERVVLAYWFAVEYVEGGTGKVTGAQVFSARFFFDKSPPLRS